MYQTSLSFAREARPLQRLVVPASRKMKSSVAAEIKNWLLQQKYSVLTAVNYTGRIERLCNKEEFTLSHRVENIASILPHYETVGKKSSYGIRSYTSVRQALRRFQMFLTAEKLA